MNGRLYQSTQPYRVRLLVLICTVFSLFFLLTFVRHVSSKASPQQEALAAARDTSPRWFVTNLKNKQVLSGEYTLDITINDVKMRYYDLILKVDGMEVGWGGEPRTGKGRKYDVFDLPTDLYNNGAHKIEVVDNVEKSQKWNVTFSNTISQVDVDDIFDTNTSDSTFPSSARVQARMNVAQKWEVAICTTEPAQKVIRTFTGLGKNINVAWDGRDQRGYEVEDDAYEVNIVAQSKTRTAKATRVTNKSCSPEKPK